MSITARFQKNITDSMCFTGELPRFLSSCVYVGVGDGDAAESLSDTGLVGLNKAYVRCLSSYPLKLISGPIEFTAKFTPSQANLSASVKPRLFWICS